MKKSNLDNIKTDINAEELKYLQDYEMSRRDFVMDSLAAGGLAATFGLSASAPAWSSHLSPWRSFTRRPADDSSTAPSPAPSSPR